LAKRREQEREVRQDQSELHANGGSDSEFDPTEHPWNAQTFSTANSPEADVRRADSCARLAEPLDDFPGLTGFAQSRKNAGHAIDVRVQVQVGRMITVVK
jgi:hypothetical protein